jgi:hypothetical protein
MFEPSIARATPPVSITKSRALEALAAEASKSARPLDVRVRLSDGTGIEGQMTLDVAAGALTVVRAGSLEITRVPFDDLQSLHVRTASRSREGLLVIGGIIVSVAALTAYSTLPWVHPARGDLTGVVMSMYTVGGAALSFVLARTGLRKWLSDWRQHYPPEP